MGGENTESKWKGESDAGNLTQGEAKKVKQELVHKEPSKVSLLRNLDFMLRQKKTPKGFKEKNDIKICILAKYGWSEE